MIPPPRHLIALTAMFVTAFVAVPARAGAPRTAAVSMLLGTINSEREHENLRPLKLDERLCAVAYEHAVDMVKRNYFNHVTPEGVDPFDRLAAAHYRFFYAGENLAVDSSVRAISLDFWLSREHRANLLGRHYSHIGIAAIPSSYGEVVVEDFSD